MNPNSETLVPDKSAFFLKSLNCLLASLNPAKGPEADIDCSPVASLSAISATRSACPTPAIAPTCPVPAACNFLSAAISSLINFILIFAFFRAISVFLLSGFAVDLLQ